jgi:predicted transcriptional regulator
MLIKSARVIKAFAYLIENGNTRANQLSQIMEVDSRHVFPILKPWILKGIVTASKFGRLNVYSISKKFKSLISSTIKRFTFKGRDYIITKAKARFKRFLGKDPDLETIQIIEYFVDKALSGNPYVTGDRNVSVAEFLSRVLGISIYDVSEILRDLVQANILFVWKNQKARLEASLLV